MLDPEHGKTFPWDVEKLAAKIYLAGSHMGTSGDLSVPGQITLTHLTSALVLGGVIGQLVAAVVGDAQQVPGHGAGHHQQPRPGHWARELHVRPDNNW